ncbi:MAG: hypothetical protein R8G66_31265 [Cytophagales bacterium]|nr:hypothetical protein [Cytophagales bacterium]
MGKIWDWINSAYSGLKNHEKVIALVLIFTTFLIIFFLGEFDIDGTKVSYKRTSSKVKRLNDSIKTLNDSLVSLNGLYDHIKTEPKGGEEPSVATPQKSNDSQETQALSNQIAKLNNEIKEVTSDRDALKEKYLKLYCSQYTLRVYGPGQLEGELTPCINKLKAMGFDAEYVKLSNARTSFKYYENEATEATEIILNVFNTCKSDLSLSPELDSDSKAAKSIQINLK